MAWKQHIPNALTAFNLIAGLIALTLVLEGDLVMASLFIFIAALFDFLDGTAARLLDARSELGKQLDSLADLVSFGVVPGLILFNLLSAGCEGSCNLLERYHITPYFALLIPVCAAFRLAKFNIDLRQEEHFIGLPVPANAIFFASVPLILFTNSYRFTLIPIDFFTGFFSNTRVLAILTVLFAYLMVSDFRLFSMKFKKTTWKGNKVQFSFLILSVLFIILFSFCAIPLIILTYFLLSLFFQKGIANSD